MKLNLKRPIIFFDLETTGLDIAKDRIVELCYIRVEPNGNEEARSMRINPEMHIPEVASSVHGITDDDVKDCPTFADVAPQLAATFEGCDLAGFNSNRFDLPLLAEEFMKAGVNIDLSHVQAIDVQNIYHKLEKRTLATPTSSTVDATWKTHTAHWPTRKQPMRYCRHNWTTTPMTCRTMWISWQSSHA